MRYRVSHISNYVYGSRWIRRRIYCTCGAAVAMAKVVIEDRIVADPKGRRRRDAEDHFGNIATWLFLDRPHADFIVTAESVVDVSYPGTSR